MGKGHAITKLFKALILILKYGESKYFRTNDLNNVLNKQVFKKKKKRIPTYQAGNTGSDREKEA